MGRSKPVGNKARDPKLSNKTRLYRGSRGGYDLSDGAPPCQPEDLVRPNIYSYQNYLHDSATPPNWFDMKGVAPGKMPKNTPLTPARTTTAEIVNRMARNALFEL